MTCRQFAERAFDYVEHRLRPEERAALDRHVAECPDCRDFHQRAHELTCRDFFDFVQSWYEGELPPEQRRVFQRHYELCPPCKNYLTTYEETIRLGKLCCGPQGAAPPSVPDELVRAILAARRASDGAPG